MVFVYFRLLAALVGYFLGGGRFVPILISEYTGLSRDLVSLCSGLDFVVVYWEFPWFPNVVTPDCLMFRFDCCNR